MKVAFTFNKTAAKTADLFLYDIIGDSWDGTTAKQFSLDLAALGPMDVLNIFINSPGGVVWDGIAIYNQLIRYKAVKNVFIDGVAASIASVVALAGDKVSTAKGAMWMIHNPYVNAFGMRAEDLRREADKLDMIANQIRGIYTDKANGKTTDKQFALWMQEEKWFTAEEALAAGLTDEVSDKVVEIAALSRHDYKSFKNPPESLKAIVANTAGTGQAVPHPALTKTSARLIARKLPATVTK